MAARNMLRTEINIHEKLSVKLVIYKDHTRMHGQQNIKYCNNYSTFLVSNMSVGMQQSKRTESHLTHINTKHDKRRRFSSVLRS